MLDLRNFFQNPLGLRWYSVDSAAFLVAISELTCDTQSRCNTKSARHARCTPRLGLRQFRLGFFTMRPSTFTFTQLLASFVYLAQANYVSSAALEFILDSN